VTEPPVKVLVRPPSESFRFALSGHADRGIIDPERALSQHGAFVSALLEAGADVVCLDPLPKMPDAPFVSDAVVAMAAPGHPAGGTRAVVATRPGAESRRPEVDSVARAAAALVSPDVRKTRVEAPGTLEGGDVIVFGDRVAIGLSARTNEAGAERMADEAQSLGYRVFLCPFGDRLHLATAVTAIGPHRLVGTEAGLESLGPAADGMEHLVVPDEELLAANVLAVGGRCLMASGHPRTAFILREAGQRVVEVPLDEFAKADGGPTCLVALVP
jgi:dimethylargininase